MSDQSPPDGVAGEDGTVKKTDGGKMMDCVGDDTVQKFTAGEESGAGSWRKRPLCKALLVF